MDKPLRISWSGLRNHEECHQKSYLLREGKRAKISNIRNFWPGMVVDHWMREYLDGKIARDTPPSDWVSLIMDESETVERDRGNMIKYRSPDDRDSVRGFCTELIHRLIPILERGVLPYAHEHGKWFKAPMTVKDVDGRPRDVVLTGEMDLLVQRPEGPVVWDLKGTADDQYYRKVVAQLVFYDLAVWATTGTKTYGVGLIQPMCTERVLSWQVTDEARRQLMVRIHQYAQDVWANERTCTTNRGVCHWCDVKHACPRFKTDALGDFAAGLRSAAGETS